MKLAIVGSVGVPASYGGFETLVEHLIGDGEHEYASSSQPHRVGKNQ